MLLLVPRSQLTWSKQQPSPAQERHHVLPAGSWEAEKGMLQADQHALLCTEQQHRARSCYPSTSYNICSRLSQVWWLQHPALGVYLSISSLCQPLWR